MMHEIEELAARKEDLSVEEAFGVLGESDMVCDEDWELPNTWVRGTDLTLRTAKARKTLGDPRMVPKAGFRLIDSETEWVAAFTAWWHYEKKNDLEATDLLSFTLLNCSQFKPEGCPWVAMVMAGGE